MKAARAPCLTCTESIGSGSHRVYGHRGKKLRVQYNSSRGACDSATMNHTITGSGFHDGVDSCSGFLSDSEVIAWYTNVFMPLVARRGLTQKVHGSMENHLFGPRGTQFPAGTVVMNHTITGSCFHDDESFGSMVEPFYKLIDSSGTVKAVRMLHLHEEDEEERQVVLPGGNDVSGESKSSVSTKHCIICGARNKRRSPLNSGGKK